MLRDDNGHPVHAVPRSQLEDLVPRSDELVHLPRLHLHVRQVAQDLRVALVDLERLAVTLDRLLVVAIDAVQEAVDVPADVAPDVVLQAQLHAFVRLLALALALHVPEDQALHRERLAVVGELLQDGIRRLEALLVRLGLVAPHHLLEQRVLLRGERHGTVRHRGGETSGASDARRERDAGEAVRGAGGLSRIGSRRRLFAFPEISPSQMMRDPRIRFECAFGRSSARCRHIGRYISDVADDGQHRGARGVFALRTRRVRLRSASDFRAPLFVSARIVAGQGTRVNPRSTPWRRLSRP